MCIAQVEASVTVILTHHLLSFALLENIVEIAKNILQYENTYVEAGGD